MSKRMKKVVVISLGGSLIIPDRIDFAFLKKFKKELRKHYRTCKFVIVCGGGSIARKYMQALREERRSEHEISLAGVRATRMNALFLIQFFGKEANDILPKTLADLKNSLVKNNVVICGALRKIRKATSDSTAAHLAHSLKTIFINMTNIKGLYSDNPLVNKNAVFIPRISWAAFEKKAYALTYKPGQHFVLDQKASSIIRRHKIKTYIIGRNVKNIANILKNKPFIGTRIEG